MPKNFFESLFLGMSEIPCTSGKDVLESLLSGETSENLVRARRREVQKRRINLTESHILGTAIGENLRRRINLT